MKLKKQFDNFEFYTHVQFAKNGALLEIPDISANDVRVKKVVVQYKADLISALTKVIDELYEE